MFNMLFMLVIGMLNQVSIKELSMRWFQSIIPAIIDALFCNDDNMIHQQIILLPFSHDK